MPRKIKIDGREITLKSGAKVFLGPYSDNESVAVRFTASTGEISRVRLSNEAVEALLSLYQTRACAHAVDGYRLVGSEICEPKERLETDAEA